MNRDQRKALKQAKFQFELRVEAKQTSDSGRWVVFLAEGSYLGLPAFIVLFISESGDVHRHWWTVAESPGSTYETAYNLAKTKSREFFDNTVAQLQQKRKAADEDANAGLTLHSPDGSTTPYLN